MSRDPHAPYTVYAADTSYFAGKLEGYLRYKGIPHQRTTIDFKSMEEIYQHTGFKKIPAVKTASGQWLFDSSQMLGWFEKQYPQPPIMPADPALVFVALLLEDYADEWLWRPAIWWRWQKRTSCLAVGWRVGEFMGAGGNRLIRQLLSWYFHWRQRREFLFGDGVGRANWQQVEALYLHELDDLQIILSEQPYLLGGHPSLADFGYFGPMFRHFSNDPDSGEIMRRRAPAVYEWTARLWNESADRLGAEQHWRWPAGTHWGNLLGRIAGDYLPYLHANAEAWQAGVKRFDFAGKSIGFSGTLTTQYRVWCRERLRQFYFDLEREARTAVDKLFLPNGGLASLAAGPTIDSGLDEALQIPRPPRQERRKQSLKLRLWGQPRN